jgi:hypothetical protein
MIHSGRIGTNATDTGTPIVRRSALVTDSDRAPPPSRTAPTSNGGNPA